MRHGVTEFIWQEKCTTTPQLEKQSQALSKRAQIVDLQIVGLLESDQFMRINSNYNKISESRPV